MKCWLLTANVDDLIEKYGFKIFDSGAGLSRYDSVVIDYTALEISNVNGLKFFYRGKEMELPDVFFPSISNTDALTVERILESAGIPSLVNLDELAVARSKVATYQRLAANNIAIPDTVLFFHHPDRASILRRFSYPFVVKPDNGYGGEGVELIHNDQELDAYFEKLKPGIVYMAQKYISQSKGKDVRVIYFDGKYHLSLMRKTGNPDEFRSNVHQGGEIISYPIDETAKKMCDKIASLFDLPILGIDLLFGENGFVVTEVNAFPGLKERADQEARNQLIYRMIDEKDGEKQNV